MILLIRLLLKVIYEKNKLTEYFYIKKKCMKVRIYTCFINAFRAKRTKKCWALKFISR